MKITLIKNCNKPMREAMRKRVTGTVNENKNKINMKELIYY